MQITSSLPKNSKTSASIWAMIIKLSHPTQTLNHELWFKCKFVIGYMERQTQKRFCPIFNSCFGPKKFPSSLKYEEKCFWSYKYQICLQGPELGLKTEFEENLTVIFITLKLAGRDHKGVLSQEDITGENLSSNRTQWLQSSCYFLETIDAPERVRR